MRSRSRRSRRCFVNAPASRHRLSACGVESGADGHQAGHHATNHDIQSRPSLQRLRRPQRQQTSASVRAARSERNFRVDICPQLYCYFRASSVCVGTRGAWASFAVKSIGTRSPSIKASRARFAPGISPGTRFRSPPRPTRPIRAKPLAANSSVAPRRSLMKSRNRKNDASALSL